MHSSQKSTRPVLKGILLAVLTGTVSTFGAFCAHGAAGQTNVCVTVSHAPNLNGGNIQGSLQQLNGESITLNSGLSLSGDLLLPGTPTVVLNGQPAFAGTVPGTGGSSPSGYQVMLNSGCSLGYVRTRTTPVVPPTVSAPSAPTGTRSVTLSAAGQSWGEPATMRDLTLNANVGLVAVPPGAYGTFTVNSGSGLVLGVAGGAQPVTYGLQNLNLNAGSTLKVVGPVVLTVANGFTANGLVGASDNPAWLRLQLASGSFSANSGSSVYGTVIAPSGTVTINGNAALVGTCASSQFILNNGGLVQWAGDSASAPLPPVATNQTVTLTENSSTSITLSGSDPQGKPLTYTVLTQPAHGLLSGMPPSLVYQPATNFYGSDAFTFLVNNGTTNSIPATVSLTVTQVYYPPVAFGQTLTNLEDTALAMTLSGSDLQAYPLSYRVVTLPEHGTLSGIAPNLTYFPATNYFGADTFTFQVNDGISNSVPAIINLTIQPVDDPPVVRAGPDQLLILPANTVSLSGGVIYDAFPGTVDTVLWSQLSGPGTVGFGDAAALETTASFSQSGVYQLQLWAGDSFLSANGFLTVTVDAPPVVSAGGSLTNAFPGRVQLAGFADDDGLPTNSALSAAWSVVGGPGTVVFENPAATNTAVTFGTNGIYVLRLTASDGIATNSTEVTVVQNLPPTVSAGANILTNGLAALLQGSASDDGLPVGVLSVHWSQASGPGTLTFGAPEATSTSVSASASGTYVLTLSASDGATSNASEVVVTFNLAPSVDAGPVQTINLGSLATLAGVVSDDQLPQNILTSLWTQVSGPGTASFADATLTNTSVAFDQPGSYTLRLTASDTLATSSADVVIQVNAAPVVRAGPDLRVTVGDWVSLAGAVTDDGLPSINSLTAKWSLVSGGLLELTTPDSPVTQARFMELGTYVLRLTASDSLATNSADVTVTVVPINRAPVVSAGPKQLVLLPQSAVLLGYVTDDGLPEGAPVMVSWSKVSGPGGVTFTYPTATNTSASFSETGDYVLRLTANDTALSSFADVKIAVRTPAMNVAPVVSAGPSRVVGLTNTASLNGFVTDDGLPQGAPLSVLWTQLSGPGTVAFSEPTLTNAQATFSEVGNYVLRLSASDTALSASNDVTITVYPYNQPPVVDAGPDQDITIPDPAVLRSALGDPTNVNVSISQSLLAVDHWNNAIGQPGISGVAAGSYASSGYVGRNCLDTGAGKVYVGGAFTQAGTITAKSMAAWDGTAWHNFYDPRPLPYASADYGDHGNGSTSTNIGWLVLDCGSAPYCTEIFQCVAARGDEAFVGGTFKDLGNLDGYLDMTAHWDGSGWNSWAFKEDGNQVIVIKTTSDKVYAGGYFTFQPTNATPQTLTNLPWAYAIVVWDGTNWDTLGSGVVDIQDTPNPYHPGANYSHAYVRAIAAATNGVVYVAGDFIMATPTGYATNIAKWNGHQWGPLGPGAVLNNHEASLALADNGDLYLGGSFSSVGGVAVRNLARWDGSRWWPVGQGTLNGVNSTVEAIVTHGRDVYVAGAFVEAGGVSASSIAKWNGQFWAPLGSAAHNGLYGTGFSLAADDTGIYVGGQFTAAGGALANNIAKWEFATPPPRVAQLAGRVTDDGLPVGATLQATWTKISGPGDVTFADPHAPVTTAAFGAPGTYVLQLSATDTEFINLDQVTVTVRGNRPPTVSAGPDQVIGLSEEAILPGFVSDDGLPAGAELASSWSVVNGPGTVTFDNPGRTNAVAHFSATGTYVLRLTANDTQFSASDDVTITVTGANQPPYGNPGNVLNVTFGTVATFNAAATLSDDGKPINVINVLWYQLSGPGVVSFANPTNANTTATFSMPGTYVVRLLVSDTELVTYRDLTVNVNFLGNGAPLVDAGPDQTVTNLFTRLQGTVLDDGLPASGTLTAYWTVVSSPPGGVVTFADSNSPITSVSFSKPGSYYLRLYASDTFYQQQSDSVFVTVSMPNQVPIVIAGPPRTLVQPTMSLPLAGIATDDGQPNYSLQVYWSKVSGPGSVSFSNPNVLTNTVTFGAVGTYVIQLGAYDGTPWVYDNMPVTIVPAGGNQPPAVNAGPDLTLYSPANTLTLNGTASDDGLPAGSSLAVSWQLVKGPAPVSFSAPNSASTQATFSQLGTYLLRLTASDSVLSNADDVVVQVLPPVNRPPVVDAGGDRVLSVTDTLPLNGTLTDDGLPAGSTLSAVWTKVGGPGPVYFTGATNLTTNLVTSARFIVPGSYLLRLTGSDSATNSSAYATITVLPADSNQPPVVSAGADFSVPQFTRVALPGSVTDDGRPVGGFLATLWSSISGPAAVYFGNASATNSTAIFYVPGTYVLRLAATDGRATAFDDVTVTVGTPTNSGPLAYAGPDLVVYRPNPALLEAALFDDGLPVGYPLTYAWSLVSGPGNVTFTPAANGLATNVVFDTLAYFSTTGPYVLRLTGTDSQFTNTDDIMVTVLPGTNAPPYVNAGPDFMTALPGPAPLHTEVSDDGLEDGWLEISWSQVSGPGPVYFSTLNGNYQATFITAGQYVLRLTADDGALTNSDDVTITVVEAGPPVAQIFSPLDGGIVTCPTQIVGTASSPILQNWTLEYRLKPADGTDTAWSQLGAATTSVESNSLAVLDPTMLLNGIYELRLSASDSLGRSVTTDTVTIIVDRNLKVGQFTVSFQDLALSVPGLPLQVTRTYDSRAAAAGIQGDFGIGWTMDINNVRLQKNRPLGRNWVESSTGSPWDLSQAYHLDPGQPRYVTITFPDGKVQKFQFNPDPLDQGLMPIDYPRWNFTPIGNTRGTLVPATYDEEDGQFLYFAGAIPGTGNLYDLNYFYDSLTSGASEDEMLRYPTLFRYTSPEGYAYLIDEIGGLQSVTDPNGNTMLISTNGLTWTNSLAGSSNTLSIAFQRDDQGRITNIVDAAGNSLSYTYGTNGNLLSFTDRTGNTNGFVYANAGFPHYLTGIVDARGITPVQNQYDSSGRLVGNVDAFGNAITYGHDLAHNREYVTNRLGQVTASDYDDHGNVVHTIDALGAETFSSYDENGNLLQTIDALGRTNSYTYDDLDNRTSVTDPLGHMTYFTYGAQRRVTSIADPLGHTVTNVFDANGNLLSMRDPLGNATTFGYNAQGLPVAMTNAQGQVMSFEYDDQGHLSREVDALGHATDYQRDANGNLLQQTTTRTTLGGLQTLTVQFQYDAQGRLTNSIFPDSSSAQTVYNALGKPAVTIDQLGRQTLTEYDALGRTTRTTYADGSSETSGYDAEGRRIASTNRLGQATFYNYDAVGRLYNTVNSDGTSTTNYFDAAGQLLASSDARGNRTFYGHDLCGRSMAVTNALGQVSLSFYDPAGNLTNAVDALGRSTAFLYDALNRRVQTVFADGTRHTTAYDVLGRRIAETDQSTNTTWFGYDALGRLTSVTNALGYVTSYAYDELGQQLSQTDANSHTTTFEYDALGRRTKRSLPGGQFETYAYNIGGLLINKTDFNGYSTTYQYDLMSRLLAKVPDPRRGEPSVTYAYNVLGLRTNMTDASGVTTYTYDGRNRLAQKTRIWSGMAFRSILTYGYDANGNLTNILSSDPNGAAVDYQYDELNRLAAVNDARLGQTIYNYDEVGNLRNFTYPNFVTTSYQYDALNRLTNLTSDRLQTPISAYAYTVGTSGNRLTAADALYPSAFNPHPSTISRIYSYDSVYHLTGETLALNGQPASLNYAYDPVGNRLSRAVSSVPLLPQSFGFDANDRVNSDTYDANGNTLLGAGFGQAQADQYDFENRLLVRQTASGIVTLRYDGDGNRVIKTVTSPTNTVTTFYVVDNLNPSGYGQVLEEHTSSDYHPSSINRVYTYGHSLISQDRLAGSQWLASFYGLDGHNNVRYLTDINGQVTDTYDYDANGNLIALSGQTPNNYRFTNQQFDSELGLYFLRARYHNPDTGRFWTQDSFDGYSSDPSSLHKYTYCAGNPVNASDPTGHVTLAEVNMAVGIAGSTLNFWEAGKRFARGDVVGGVQSVGWGLLGLLGVGIGGGGAFPGLASALGTGGELAVAAASSVEVQAAGTAAGILSTGNALNIKQLIDLLTINMSGGSSNGGSQGNDAEGSVWDLGWGARGTAIEQQLGANLPANFPVIDRFADGIATSIKSIDLTAASYQNTATLASRLNGYIDSVAGFNGANWAGISIDASQITARQLQLAIPQGGASAAQQAVINAAAARAQSMGVSFIVTLVP